LSCWSSLHCLPAPAIRLNVATACGTSPWCSGRPGHTQALSAFPVNLAHQANVSHLLFSIILINTYRIDPNRSFRFELAALG
jgi:hypothetical protein